MDTAALPLAADDVEAILGSWDRLNAVLMELPIDAVEQLLQNEIANRCRPTLILRLYGRYGVLRSYREKSLLLQGKWIK